MKIGSRNTLLGVVVAVAGTIILGAVFAFQSRFIPALTELAGRLDQSSGTVIMCVESGIGDRWTLNFHRASDGFSKYHTMTLDEGELLSADVTCETGELQLLIRQGDVEKAVTFDAGSEPMEISLDEFHSGCLRLQVISYGAEQLKSRFELVEKGD